MSKTSNNNPTARLYRDKKALKWLEEHSSDPALAGGFQACLPYKGNFTKSLSFDRQLMSDAITAALPQLSQAERELAELYLKMPPREMVKLLQIRRSLVYDRLARLRAKCVALAAKRRDAYVNQRDIDLTPKGLDSWPERVALRTLRFRLHEKVAHAYLIARDDDRIWVDEAGFAFGVDIQDILNNAAEDLADAEVLDVEALG